MNEFVPEDIWDLIKRIEAHKGEKFLAQKRARDAEAERLGAIEALRQERRTELREACDRIEAWIEAFNGTVGQSIWPLIGSGSSLVLFSGKFSRGEPTPPGDVVHGAQLRIGGPEASVTERMVYEELHKGQSTSRQPLLGASSLWKYVHPDFVAECDAHLAGPDAWKRIRHRLEQLIPQLVPVR